jgi:hypothetical protein
MQSLKRKRQEAGRRGGLATLARHGVDHFRRIGAEGARAFWKRYRFSPVGTSQFAIVRRDDQKVVAFLDGRPF